MANILKRFSEIMSSNINSILDKMENPEKMMDQYISGMEDDLADVKYQTASVMAEASFVDNKINVLKGEISSYEGMIRAALEKNDDTGATVLTKKKLSMDDELAELMKAKDVADENVAKMKEMYEKLSSDINQLKNKRAMLKAKIAVADSKDKVNGISSKDSKATGNVEAFSKLEEKINKRLAVAEAVEGLEAETDETTKYVREYKKTSADKRVRDELARIKEAM